MENSKKRGKQFFANRMHSQLFMIISFAAIFPTILTAIGLYYLIFNITADQIAFPEAIAHNLIPAAKKVTAILLVILPVTLFVILFISHKITHKIVGPFDRVVRELRSCVEDKKKGPIIVRQSDKFRPLVDLINKLLERLG